MTESPAFACMMGIPNMQQPMYQDPYPLFSPPMKTWMELFMEQTGCSADEIRLCHSVGNGVERWWWERTETPPPAE